MQLIGKTYCALIASLAVAASSQAAVVITEVNSNGSSSAYAADWFELTNTGASAVTLTGWKIDDDSNAFASAVALSGVTTLAAGESAVFIESSDGSKVPAFQTAWFGSSLPVGLQVGYYGGSGIGLSSGGDSVNLFNADGVAQANVSFGALTVGRTLDNAAGLSGAISTLSTVDVNGAFTSPGTSEIGSPGLIANTPEPAALSLLALGGLALTKRRRA